MTLLYSRPTKQRVLLLRSKLPVLPLGLKQLVLQPTRLRLSELQVITPVRPVAVALLAAVVLLEVVVAVVAVALPVAQVVVLVLVLVPQMEPAAELTTVWVASAAAKYSHNHLIYHR